MIFWLVCKTYMYILTNFSCIYWLIYLYICIYIYKLYKIIVNKFKIYCTITWITCWNLLTTLSWIWFTHNSPLNLIYSQLSTESHLLTTLSWIWFTHSSPLNLIYSQLSAESDLLTSLSWIWFTHNSPLNLIYSQLSPESDLLTTLSWIWFTHNSQLNLRNFNQVIQVMVQ